LKTRIFFCNMDGKENKDSQTVSCKLESKEDILKLEPISSEEILKIVSINCGNDWKDVIVKEEPSDMANNMPKDMPADMVSEKQSSRLSDMLCVMSVKGELIFEEKSCFDSVTEQEQFDGKLEVKETVMECEYTASNVEKEHSDGNLKYVKEISKEVQSGKMHFASDMSDSTVNSVKANSVPKQIYYYKCSYCDYKSSNGYKVKAHQRIHTGEKPFQCDYVTCQLRFTQKSGLKRHQLVHTGEKPFKCDSCESRFSYKSSLKRHQRTHYREKP